MMADCETDRGVKRKRAIDDDSGSYSTRQCSIYPGSVDETNVDNPMVFENDIFDETEHFPEAIEVDSDSDFRYQYADEPLTLDFSPTYNAERSTPNLIDIMMPPSTHNFGYDNTLTTQQSSTLEEVPETEEICFGSICNVNVRFLAGPPTSIDHTWNVENYGNSDEIHILEVLLGAESCVICSPLVDEIVGLVNLTVSRSLTKLFDIAGTRMEIYLTTLEWRTLASSGAINPPTGCVELVILGKSEDACLISDSLSSKHIFLQDPTLNPTTPYRNPQKFGCSEFLDEDLSSVESEDIDDASGLLTQQKPRKLSKQSLQYVLDNINIHDLHPVEPDGHLTVSLFPHQKEAIDFMIRRETGQLTSSLALCQAHTGQDGKTLYSHTITGMPLDRASVGPFGGILADTMGLGKTISTLSTIVSTLEHAKEWANSIPDQSMIEKRRTQASLVIVPSEAIMNQWLNEISKKFVPNTFKTCRFHGGSRKSQFTNFEGFDIVLTTYGIVKSDSRDGLSPLFQHGFFRIVLDEAHHIKTRSTKVHDAICNLSAARRWCLTGTPIQNSLEDLGALVSFLRVPLLEETKVFRSHIINQAYSGSVNCFENLRFLLGFICLRRNTSIGMLVEPKINVLEMDLSPDEKAAYQNILDYHDRASDLHVSGKGQAENSCNAFNALLELRIFCNNGLYKGRDPTTPTNPFDVEEYFNFLLESQKTECSACGNNVLFLEGSELPDTGVFTECLELICGACSKLTRGNDSSIVTPLQPSILQCPRFSGQLGLSKSDSPQWNHSFGANRQHLHPSDQTFSTKLQALLGKIQDHVPHEKGIVFSAWTKSLDLVAMMLQKADISFVQVEGSLSNSQRERAFEQFKTSDTVNILLITVGAGAVGLNLSVATQVHILEPSWNPMVEKQAIGRVVRLDQRKPVTITHYIMRNTVEESVVRKQDFKMRVAMNGFHPRSGEAAHAEKSPGSNASEISMA